MDSSSLALYKSSMLGNRAGILMPSDLQAVTESLETVVAPITEVHISSRTLFKQSSFTNNGDKQGASAASPAGDLIAFDSTMIYKDDDTMINVETTCGGGTDCKQYMEATFQPLPCAGGSPVPFLIGKEDWVLATQQVSLLCQFPSTSFTCVSLHEKITCSLASECASLVVS